MSVQRLGLRRERAMLRFEGGRYLDAESDLTAVIAELGEPSDPGPAYELGRALIDRATVRRVLNRWADAGADLDACEALLPVLGRVPAESLRTNVDLIRAQLHLTPEAPQHDPARAGEIVDSMREGGWWIREAAANRAFRAGEWEQAAAGYAELTGAMEAEGWDQGAAASALRVGTSLLELDRPADAAPWLGRAIAFFAELGPSDLRAHAERQMARLCLREGRPDDGWAHAQVALGIVETSVRSFRSLHDEQRFLADKATYYEDAFAVALASDGADGAWRAIEVAERAKSFYLCQLLANADVPLFDGVDAAAIDLLRLLEARLDELEAERGGVADRDRADELAAVAGERDELFAAIMRDHPRWAAARVPQPFDPRCEADALPAGWAALSLFWLGEEELHMFLIVPGKPPYHRHERWTGTQVERLRTSQAALRAASDADLFFHGPVIPAELCPLVMPADVLARVPAGTRLLVSPHGFLRGVPMHVAGAEGAGRLPAHGVQYIPSLAMLGLRRPASGSHGVLLLGSATNGFGDPPLTGVADELERVASAWAGSGEAATEVISLDPDEGVDVSDAEEWSRYRVLHLACHGQFDEQRPLDAALRLGSSALRMSELFALRLDADLVCLSACDLGGLGSGLADVGAAGDEWLGLTMPFLYAGARTILVSLWKANDTATARLMPCLHAGIRSNAEPAEALYTALSSIADDDDVYWANWYLVGFPPALSHSRQEHHA